MGNGNHEENKEYISFPILATRGSYVIIRRQKNQNPLSEFRTLEDEVFVCFLCLEPHGKAPSVYQEPTAALAHLSSKHGISPFLEA